MCIRDRLILDVMMPELDGFTFLKEKRREIDIPVLFLTAKNFEQDLVEGFSVGADDYMIKPFSIKELRYRIMAHLRRENRTKSNLIPVSYTHLDVYKRQIRDLSNGKPARHFTPLSTLWWCSYCPLRLLLTLPITLKR